MTIVINNIYTYIVNKIKWRMEKLILTLNNFINLYERINNIQHYYAFRWKIIGYKSIIKHNDAYDSINNVKNYIRLLTIKNEDKFKKALDDTVLSIYDKKRYNHNELCYSTYESFDQVD